MIYAIASNECFAVFEPNEHVFGMLVFRSVIYYVTIRQIDFINDNSPIIADIVPVTFECLIVDFLKVVLL